MLIENTLFGTVDKVQVAIDRLRAHEPEEGYYLAFSGGKDSMVILGLALMSEVKFEVHNNHTTVDPPELVYFIRDMKKWLKDKYGKDLEIHYPEKTMWQLIPELKMPPTRIVRYCCKILKEGGGSGRVVMTGVRWEESVKRSKRRMVEVCMTDKTKIFTNPIIDWTTAEVWEFIKKYNLPYCELYDKGFKRLGCIGCPMGGKNGMEREFALYPKHYQGYLLAFKKMLDKRKKKGLKTDWKTADEVMQWWIYGSDKGNPDQTVMFE